MDNKSESHVRSIPVRDLDEKVAILCHSQTEACEYGYLYLLVGQIVRHIHFGMETPQSLIADSDRCWRFPRIL